MSPTPPSVWRDDSPKLHDRAKPASRDETILSCPFLFLPVDKTRLSCSLPAPPTLLGQIVNGASSYLNITPSDHDTTMPTLAALANTTCKDRRYDFLLHQTYISLTVPIFRTGRLLSPTTTNNSASCVETLIDAANLHPAIVYKDPTPSPHPSIALPSQQATLLFFSSFGTACCAYFAVKRIDYPV